MANRTSTCPGILLFVICASSASAQLGRNAQKSKQASIDALVQLADRYYAAKQYPQAKQLYERAAKAGNGHAATFIGAIYALQGDDKNAAHWYQVGVGLGDPDAMNQLGVCYSKALGLEKDPKEAVRLFKQAAAQNRVLAFTNLGLAYEAGDGVTKDLLEARRWLNRAADLGEAYAAAELVKLGEPALEQDATRQFVAAFSDGAWECDGGQCDSPKSMDSSTWMFFDGYGKGNWRRSGNPADLSVEWFDGSSFAVRRTEHTFNGPIVYSYAGTIHGDRLEGTMTWVTLKGIVTAPWSATSVCGGGSSPASSAADADNRGVKAAEAGDDSAAICWWKTADRLGSLKAKTRLGLVYLTGSPVQGIRQDYEHALNLFTAAKGQDPEAEYYLATMALFGWGMPSNPEAAVNQLRDLARARNPYARDYLVCASDSVQEAMMSLLEEMVRDPRVRLDQALISLIGNLGGVNVAVHEHNFHVQYIGAVGNFSSEAEFSCNAWLTAEREVTTFIPDSDGKTHTVVPKTLASAVATKQPFTVSKQGDGKYMVTLSYAGLTGAGPFGSPHSYTRVVAGPTW